MTDFLSAAELASLIGCEGNQHQEIAKWLDHHHWGYVMDKNGLPKVARACAASEAAAREKAAALAAQLAEAGKTLEKNQAALAAERQTHAATQARLEAGGTEPEAAQLQLDEMRTQFSAELERARADRRR
jgi:hypothetical protein